MIGSEVWLTPDWSITGVRLNERFCVVASRDLREASVETHYAEGDGFHFPFLAPSHIDYIELKTRMTHFHLFFGDSYEEALSNMTKNWSPTKTSELTAQRESLGDR